MTSFDEGKHRRTGEGKFTYKPHEEAEGGLLELEPEPEEEAVGGHVPELAALLDVDADHAALLEALSGPHAMNLNPPHA